MDLTALRLGLACLWGVVGLGLLTRSWWAGGALDARAAGRDLTLFGGVALALAGWNLFRVALSRSRRPRVRIADEVAAKRERPAREVTDPEFGFGEDGQSPRGA